MKKYLLIFIIVLSFLAIKPVNVFATSGACSDHGGVNCSVISSSDSNAVCNDGWKSSTNYYNTDECFAQKKTTCFAPIKIGCTTDFDLGLLGKQMVQNGMMQYAPEMNDQALTNCRNQVNKYQSDMANYQTCLNQNDSIVTPHPVAVTPTRGYNIDLNTKLQEYCVSKYGSNSIYNTGLNCDCKPGYSKDFNLNNTSPNAKLDFQCQPENEVCGDSRATYNQTTSKCECKGTFIYINDKCEVDQEKLNVMSSEILGDKAENTTPVIPIKKAKPLSLSDFTPSKTTTTSPKKSNASLDNIFGKTTLVVTPTPPPVQAPVHKSFWGRVANFFKNIF